MALRYNGSLAYQLALEDEQAPDIIYYNGNIVNNGTDTPAGQNPPIRFSETRDVPILSDASLYTFSIVRFTMNGNGKALPMFIPQIETSVAKNTLLNINRTVYAGNVKAVLTFLDNTATPQTRTIYATDVLPVNQRDLGIPVIYTPENLDPLVARPPTTQSIIDGQQDLTTQYYWVSNYSWWLKMVNQMFSDAHLAIQNRFNALWNTPVANGGWGQAGAAPTLGTTHPRLFYNPNSNLFSLYADSYGYGTAENGTTPIGTSQNNILAPGVGREFFEVYFNINLWGLFSNFKHNVERSVWATGAEEYYRIWVNNYLFQNITTTPIVPAPVPPNQPTPSPVNQKAYWVMIQDYESSSTLWSPIASLVFTSTFLPIVNEYAGAPIRLGTGNNTAITVPSAFQPIITDVALANQSANDYRGFINYTPQGEYRITSFQKGKNEIRQLDIQVFWKNRLNGRLYPVGMYNLSSVEIKIMFRKRGNPAG
jgi:hypothetical protein